MSVMEAADGPGPGADKSVVKEKRRAGDLAFGVVGLFLQVGTGLIMLPLAAAVLPPAALTFWSVFLVMQTITYLLELGFTPTFARNFTYVFVGKGNLAAEGMPEHGDDNEHFRFKDLLAASRALFAALALLVLLIVGVGGTAYVAALAKTATYTPDLWPAWALFTITLVIHTYLNWQTGLVMGADRMRQYYQAITVSRLAQVAVSVICAIYMRNLMGFVIGYAASAVVLRIYYHFIARDLTAMARAEGGEKAAVWPVLKKISPNALRAGWAMIGIFLTNRFSFLVISLTIGATLAAEYAIAQQAFFALNGVAIVAGSMLNPRMAAARVSGEDDLARDLHAFGVSFAIAAFALGSIAMMVLGNPILDLIGSQTHLPALSILVAMAIVFLLELNMNFGLGAIATGNRIPQVRAVLVTGVVVAIGVMIVGWAGGGLLMFVAVQGLAQLAFNFWRWPLEALDDLGMKPARFFHHAVSGARRTLFHHV